MIADEWRTVAALYASTTTLVERVRNARGETRIRKQLRSTAHAGAELARYRHEYAVNRGLDSPRIVAAVGRTDTAEHMHLLFRDSDAGTLHDVRTARIAQRQGSRAAPESDPAYLDWALAIAEQTIDAIGALHEQGFVHRDLNPTNLVVAANGTVQLIDLSVAAPIGDVQRLATPLGTLPYLPPEQTGRVDARCDPRADIYSFGIVLYELCTGRLPFSASDAASWVQAHIADDPIDPRSIAPHISAALHDMLMRMLAKLPQQRFASAQDILAAIRRCRAGLRSNDTLMPMPAESPAGTPAPTGTVQSTESVSLLAAQGFEAMRPAPTARLIERERELTFFADELRRIQSGSPAAIVLQGAPGSGRAALLAEVRATWKAAGALWCQADASSDAAELQSILLNVARQAARQMLMRPTQELLLWQSRLQSDLGERLALLAPWIDELAMLTPSGNGRGISAAASATTQASARHERAGHAQFTERLLTPDVLRGFFASFAPTPLVLQLNDAELWSEAGAAHAVACLPNGSVTLILTTTDVRTSSLTEHASPVNAQHDGGSAIGNLIDQALACWPRAHVRSLEPLSAAGVREMVSGLLHPMQTRDLEQLSAVLDSSCSGQPRLILAAIEHLRRSGAIGWSAGRFALDRAALQAAEPDLIANGGSVDYLTSLDDASRRALGYAACLGSPMEIAVLTAVLDAPLRTVLSWLLEPLASGILQRNDPLDGLPATLAFARRELEQQALAGLSRAERRRCHERAAHVLLLADMDRAVQSSRAASDSTTGAHPTSASPTSANPSNSGAADTQLTSVTTRRLSPRALRNDGQRLLRLAHHLNESVDLDAGLPGGAIARRLARFNLRAGELAQRGGMHRLAYRHFRFGLLLARGTPEPATVRALARGCCMSSWLLRDLQQAQRSAAELLALPAIDALAADEDALLARQCTDAALGHFPERLMQGSSKPPALDDTTVRAFTALLAAPVAVSTDLRWRRLLAGSAVQAMSTQPEITLRAAELLLAEAHGTFDAGAHLATAIVSWLGAGRRPAAARALLVAAQDIPQLDARTRILWSGYVAPRTGEREAHIERLLDATRAALGSADMSAVRLGCSALAGNRFWSHISLRTQTRTLTALQRDLTDIHGLPGGDTVGHYVAAIAGLRSGVEVLWDTQQPLPLLALLHQQSLALLLALLNDEHAALDALLTQCQLPPALAMAFDIAPIHCALLALAWIRSSDKQHSPRACAGTAANTSANAPHTTLPELRSRLRSAGVSPELRLLVSAEQARVQGKFAEALRAWQKISEGSLPLPLRVLAASRATLLPGPGKRQREQRAGALRAEWGSTTRGAPAEHSVERTERETNSLTELLPGILALSEALEPTAVAMRACREALHLTRSVGCWLFVRAHTQDEQTHSDDVHLLAQVHTSGAPPMQPPWELLRYVVRSGRALDPDAAAELGASSALLLPFHDHVDSGSPDYLQAAGLGLGVAGLATGAAGTTAIASRRDNPVRGVLALALPDNERASSRDPHLLLLVSQLGVALRNARLHESLMFARDEYRGLFEAAREGLMEAAPAGRMLQANPALARMLGFPSAALLLVEYPHINDLFGQEDDIAEHIHGHWASGTDTRFEALAQRRDGSRLWVEISVRGRTRESARASSAGTQAKQPTMACALLDVTDRKEREHAERAQLQATASAAARSEFLAHISHEIRTPLNAIVGASQLANSASDPAQTRKLLRAVDAAARQLQALMGDVLDAARLDAGQLQLEHTPIDLRALLDECVTLFAPMAQGKGLALHMHIQVQPGADADPAQETWIEGDPLRLRQILHNLVGNAVKFTHQGEIWLRAEFDTVAEPAQLLLHVQDSGIGIAAEAAATLFQPFVQADAGIARQYGGSGLGLAIVNQLVQLMGGTLSLASTPGKGSTFSCRLPLRVPTALPDRAQLAGLRVLLVDDNPLNRTVAEALLQKLGAQATLADSGHRALQCVAEGTFDLILLDIHMPGLDGFATAQLLQQLPQDLPPIVALSADTTSSAMQRALDAGFANYLHKPLEPAQLAVLLGQIGHTAANTLADDAAAAPEIPSGQPVSVIASSDDLDTETQDFDLQLALHRHGDNRKLLDRLLLEFVVHYADAPQDLRGLISSGQTMQAMRLAHNLKSVAGSFGARRLAACSAALEAEQRVLLESASANGDARSQGHPAPEQLLGEFATAHQRFMRALRAYQQRAPH